HDALPIYPLGRHLFAVQDLLCGQHRGAPLEVGVAQGDRGHAGVLPLAHEAQLVLTHEHGVVGSHVLECLDGCDRTVSGIHPDSVDVTTLQVLGDDALDLGGVTLGEFGAHDLELALGEDVVRGAPAVFENVHAGQDPQGQYLRAGLEVLHEELCPAGAVGVTADRVDEGDGAVGVHSTVEDDHRRTTVTSRSHCRGQCRGGRGRDDDGVAVSVGDEGLDVRDLLIVVVTGVGYPELTDDSFVLEHL